jgi:LysR family transcriptional regulator, glycine cleavage system transcriptional activator
VMAVDGRERGAAADVKASMPAAVASGDLTYDLMVRFGLGNYPGYSVEQLFLPAYVVVCSPALVNGAHPLREPADLRWHTLIRDTTVAEVDDRPGWGQWLDLAGVSELADQGRGPHFEDAALAVEAAIAGHGVALAARPLVSADIALGRLAMPFSLSIPSRYAYYVTTPPLTAGRPTVRAVLDWLKKEAAQERDDASMPASSVMSSTPASRTSRPRSKKTS